MYIDIVGNRYGKLTVLERTEDYIQPNGNREVQYLCKCDCGNIITTRGRYLRRGTKVSCGCESATQTYHYKRNIYDLTNDYGVGYTTNTNKKFYFDLQDYETIKDFCWWEDSNGYITTHQYKKYGLFMHRIIVNPPKDKVVDHINHNKNDNRRCNLRICTRGENNLNKEIKSNNTSGYTGVSFSNEKNKWRASIRKNGKSYTLGYFKNIEDAIKARKDAEKIYFNEWAYDNCINQNIIEE